SVAFDLDLWHDLETGFEPQRFTFMQVQVGDPWLRDRDQTLLFRFFAKVARDQGFHDIALQVLGETLANDGGGHVSSAKTRQTGKLLILLNQRIGFTSDFSSGISIWISRLVLLAVSVGLTFTFRDRPESGEPLLANLSVKREGRSVNDPKVLLSPKIRSPLFSGWELRAESWFYPQAKCRRLWSVWRPLKNR